MRSHDQIGISMADHLCKGDQIGIFQLLLCLFNQRQTGMAVRGGITMSREMFQTGHNPAFLQSLHICLGVQRNHERIIRKSADPDHRIGRIGIDIRNRCEIGVEAKSRQLAADDFCGFIGISRIARGG